MTGNTRLVAQAIQKGTARDDTFYGTKPLPEELPEGLNISPEEWEKLKPKRIPPEEQSTIEPLRKRKEHPKSSYGTVSSAYVTGQPGAGKRKVRFVGSMRT